MLLRTWIEGTVDGQVKIERQARVGISGSAHERKKKIRAGVKETWRVVERVIAPSLRRLPAKAKDWPIVQQITIDPDANAAERLGNTIVASVYRDKAEEIVSEIERKLAEFSMPPAKKVRVVLVEEE